MVAPPAPDAFWNAPLSRRRFVKGLGLAGVSLALGQLGIPSARADTWTDENTPVVFPQSVASGDPTTDGGILWTRIGQYNPAEPVYVEIAPGPGPTGDSGQTAFNAAKVTAGVVAPGEVAAGNDHCIKFKLTGQASDSRVRYRFVHDGVASRIGVLRTLPAAGATVAQLRIAQVTCQNYSRGHYTAYRTIATEAGEDGTGIDYIVHLGDLIYEYFDLQNAENKGPRRPLSDDDEAAYIAAQQGTAINTTAIGLASYRVIHRIYRNDPDYQRALERCTLIATWDDHEVHNDWTGKGGPRYEGGTAMSTAKFTGAVKAWTEWVPTRMEFPPEWMAGLTGGAVAYQDHHWKMYRDFQFGKLAHLWMTDLHWFKDRGVPIEDTRLDGTPLEKSDILVHDDRPKDVALGEDYGGKAKTHLGPLQKDWLITGIKAAAATVAWNVWGCSKPMANPAGASVHPALTGPEARAADEVVDLGTGATGGSWSEYATERDFILTQIARTNTIVLAGDNHRPQAAILRERVGDPTALPAAVEFMTPALSSITGGYWSDSSANPSDASQGLRFAGQHGVDDAEATPGRTKEVTTAELQEDANEAVAGAGPKALDTRYAPRPFRGYSVLTLTPTLARWDVHAVNCNIPTGGETGIPKSFLVPHGAPVILDDMVDYAQRGVQHTQENPPEVPEPTVPEVPPLDLPASSPGNPLAQLLRLPNLT